VAAWIEGRIERASTSKSARANARTAFGPAMLLVYLAYQLRNRSSPARLGVWRSTMASVPQASSRRATTASATSRGIPIVPGSVATHFADVLARISATVRSG
jgi:hypothetical protein